MESCSTATSKRDDHQHIHMNRRLVLKIILGTAVAALVATGIVAFGLRKPKQQWKNPVQKPELEMAVRFIGLTNYAYGTKEAIFELSNIGQLPIELEYPGRIETDGSQWGGGFFFSASSLLETTSPPVRVNLPVPETYGRWRGTFSFTRGVKIRPATMNGFAAHSEWLKPTAEVTNWNAWLQSPRVETNAAKSASN